MIAFVLLCGCLPFDDDSSRISSDAAARKKFTLRFPRWAASLSASAKDLLHNLLDVNPKTRFTAEQALNHPWVAGRTVQLNNYLQSPSMMGTCTPLTYLLCTTPTQFNSYTIYYPLSYYRQEPQRPPLAPDHSRPLHVSRQERIEQGQCRQARCHRRRELLPYFYYWYSALYYDYIVLLLYSVFIAYSCYYTAGAGTGAGAATQAANRRNDPFSTYNTNYQNFNNAVGGYNPVRKNSI